MSFLAFLTAVIQHKTEAVEPHVEPHALPKLAHQAMVQPICWLQRVASANTGLSDFEFKVYGACDSEYLSFGFRVLGFKV